MTDRSDRCQVVLFDFFGTLAEYEPDRRRLHYPETHALVMRWGHKVAADLFVAQWDAASAALEAHATSTFEEFTMLDAALAFADAAGLRISSGQGQELADAFITEWQQHVVPVAGVPDLIARLSATYRLGIVSNTHDAAMVPAMLGSMGIVENFEVIVLSVEHGYRKPHPSIYDTALERLGCRAGDVAFVGDSYEADYLGPRRAGMAAHLIDPHQAFRLSPSARLTSVLDIEARLHP